LDPLKPSDGQKFEFLKATMTDDRYPDMTAVGIYSMWHSRGQHRYYRADDDWVYYVGVHIGATWRIRLDRLRVPRRCGLMSYYFDHLFIITVRRNGPSAV